MFFGIAVFLVMYLVVMPLCAFHFKGPYTLRASDHRDRGAYAADRIADRVEPAQVGGLERVGLYLLVLASIQV